MARVFVRLKLRMLRNRLATGGFLSGVGFVIVWLTALAGGLGGALLLGVISRAAEEVIDQLTVLVFAGVGVAWLIVPVVLASLDDSLEARTFELLPFTPSQLARGLLAASLVGPGALATVLGLGLGSLSAYGSPAASVPIAIVAVLTLLLCVAAARWATTALSDLLRQRRGQEVAVLVVVALTTLPALVSVSLSGTASAGDLSASLSSLVGIVQWSPWGALGRAVVAFGNGEWWVATVALLYGIAVALGAVALFGRALRRLTITVPAATAAKPGRAGSRLLPTRIPLPATPVGAVAARELIGVRRDVRMRGQLLGGLVAIAVLTFVGGRTVLQTPFAPFISVLVVFILVTAVTPNQFGYDAGSFWAYLTIAPDLGSVLRGKNLGWAIVSVPLAVVAAFIGAALSGEWAYLAAALFGSLSIALIWLGVGNLISIYGAFPMPETNLFGSRNVSGGAFVATMLGIMATGVLTLPPLLAVGVPAVLSAPLWATVGAAAGAAYAAFVYRVAARRAAILAHHRRFALLETLDGER